jgi:hypothetical protein
MFRENKPISFDQVVTALLDMSVPFPATYLHQFSDMTSADLKQIAAAWPKVPADRRAALLEDLEGIAEADTLVNFDEISRMALQDSDPRARSVAIRLLWECEDSHLVPTFLKMMQSDSDENVRAAAATALGLFVYMGELEEIPEAMLHTIEDSLIQTIQGTDTPFVRRHALESLGYSGRPEVNGLIKTAFAQKSDEWKSSALFAMGRSADSVWEKQIMQMIRHPSPLVQLEAVRAAGSLALAAARPYLLKMLKKREEMDEDIFAATIWSLSQIGGEEVQQALETLHENTEDDDEIELLENALDNLEFTNGMPLFDILDVDVEDEEDLDTIIELEEEASDEDEEAPDDYTEPDGEQNDETGD